VPVLDRPDELERRLQERLDPLGPALRDQLSAEDSAMLAALMDFKVPTRERLEFLGG
jgi:hypothetical protein